MILKIQKPFPKSWIEQLVKTAVPNHFEFIETVQTVGIEFQSPNNGSAVNLTALTVHGEWAITSISNQDLMISNKELMTLIFGALKDSHQIHRLNFVPGPQGWNDFECYVTRHAEPSHFVWLKSSGFDKSKGKTS